MKNLTNAPMEDFTLQHDLVMLGELIRRRVCDDLKGDDLFELFEDLSGDLPGGYASLVHEHAMTREERVVFLLAVATHFMPSAFDIFYDPANHSNLKFSEAGGRTSPQTRVYLPTGRMALYILNTDWEHAHLFDYEHFFRKNNILSLSNVAEGVPFIDGILSLSEEYLNFLITGSYEPRYGENFPAKKITTDLGWEDAVLRAEVKQQIDEIASWMKYEQQILSHPVLKTKIKRGYRALFYGKSGTGKTLTATLLGKMFDKPLYRIDLSMVVSKYVGETEKNMEKIFSMAESRGWILFFDEAEALFGKRSSGETANDRYANQEVAYLLQRIEDYDGVLILASNKLFDIDEAFTRRFQSMIEFPEPNAQERLLLWQKIFEGTGFDMSETDFTWLAENREATGGMLVNVLRFAALRVLERGDNVLQQEDVLLGLKKEYAKENRMWVEVPQRNAYPRKQVKMRAE